MAPVRLPRVLVTNDDGIQAPGIRALISALMKEGLFDVGLFYAKANTCVCIACTPNDYQSTLAPAHHRLLFAPPMANVAHSRMQSRWGSTSLACLGRLWNFIYALGLAHRSPSYVASCLVARFRLTGQQLILA